MKTTYYAFFFVLSLFSAGSSAEVIRLGVTDYAANGVHQELIRDIAGEEGAPTLRTKSDL